ncbi:hypothetical protein [Alkalicoccobacillus porphyridii]|uniref:Uncharacterized protein n=1 Tax=Alkalicoccobacillus porphyridii TaxID=2597270 RepID=A0A553ZX64_9BACI|nr:hypothetical protein [Alkalicoccobacillus porphyridii]TSB45985.1 hypothetical protein FN960_13860 [Alkalicoccobacillus porphyridii]
MGIIIHVKNLVLFAIISVVCFFSIFNVSATNEEQPTIATTLSAFMIYYLLWAAFYYIDVNARNWLVTVLSAIGFVILFITLFPQLIWFLHYLING